MSRKKKLPPRKPYSKADIAVFNRLLGLDEFKIKRSVTPELIEILEFIGRGCLLSKKIHQEAYSLHLRVLQLLSYQLFKEDKNDGEQRIDPTGKTGPRTD
jgi:hypothetical protein